MIIMAAIIVFLLFASAFFSSSETALTATSEARMRTLSRQGNKNARIVEKLLSNRDHLLSSLLIGNNIVNVAATSMATSLAITALHEGAVIIASMAMTIILVIFAEVIPKTYAFHNADRLALIVAMPVRAIIYTLTPLSLGLSYIAKQIVKPKEEDDDERQEELRGLIELRASVADDEDIREQAAMLSSVLDLGDVMVDEVMTHRASVEMINAESDIKTILQQVVKSPYTRYPVYSGKPENILGVLHAKDLLRHLNSKVDTKTPNMEIEKITSPSYFVPETTSLIDQLHAFRNRREHFAMVVDEYGDFRGIVTLEDILEEIVGDIDDEHDIELIGVVSQDDGSWIVDGNVTIRDLNRAFNLNLPDDDAATIAGLILSETRSIPKEGQEFNIHQIRLLVLKRTHNKIERVQIWHTPPKDDK